MSHLHKIYEINLIKVIEKFTKVIYRSHKYWCCCLLHKEKTPSCIVNESKFYCFGCGKHGNIITLYMEYFDLNLNAAIIRICEEFDIEIIHTNNNTSEILNSACQIYQTNLHKIDKYIK